MYNLCSERAYPANKFHNHVAVYPFDDHNVPSLWTVEDFCCDVARWLSRDPDNVAAVHCKAGKGRTGLMLACYLLHAGAVETADEALMAFGSRRTQDGKVGSVLRGVAGHS